MLLREVNAGGIKFMLQFKLFLMHPTANIWVCFMLIQLLLRIRHREETCNFLPLNNSKYLLLKTQNSTTSMGEATSTFTLLLTFVPAPSVSMKHFNSLKTQR